MPVIARRKKPPRPVVTPRVEKSVVPKEVARKRTVGGKEIVMLTPRLTADAINSFKEFISILQKKWEHNAVELQSKVAVLDKNAANQLIKEETRKDALAGLTPPELPDHLLRGLEGKAMQIRAIALQKVYDQVNQ